MSGNVFTLHPRLAAGGAFVVDLTVSRVLLKHDARWPWLILIPRRAEITDLHDLESADRATLMEEIAACSRAIAAEAGVEKINVAALGNQVAQLHIHVIGRWPDDPAWPEAVFAASGAKAPYTDEALAARIARLRDRLSADQTLHA